MTYSYVTHAHNVEELRQEFLSDLRRRIRNLAAQENMARSATEKAKIATATLEVMDIMEFWINIEIKGQKKRERKGPLANPPQIPENFDGDDCDIILGERHD